MLVAPWAVLWVSLALVLRQWINHTVQSCLTCHGAGGKPPEAARECNWGSRHWTGDRSQMQEQEARDLKPPNTPRLVRKSCHGQPRSRTFSSKKLFWALAFPEPLQLGQIHGPLGEAMWSTTMFQIEFNYWSCSVCSNIDNTGAPQQWKSQTKG